MLLAVLGAASPTQATAGLLRFHDQLINAGHRRPPATPSQGMALSLSIWGRSSSLLASPPPGPNVG